MGDLLGVDVRLDVPEVALGVVVGRGVVVGEAPEALVREIEAAVGSAGPNEGRSGAVRDMLRHGKYKPTGRGKPACEYLLRSATEGRFPRINNLVDALNLVSLGRMLPISMIDLSLANSGSFVVRWGRARESYVFNAGGQEIDLEDLLSVAVLPEDRPCANPVKDSMATKLVDGSRDVLAIIYAPASLAGVCEDAAAELARAIERHGGARQVACGRISAV